MVYLFCISQTLNRFAYLLSVNSSTIHVRSFSKCTVMGRDTEVFCEQHRCLQTPELIDEINSQDLSWRARNYSEFWGRTLDEGVKLRLGTLNPSRSVRSVNFFDVYFSNFDSFRFECDQFEQIRSTVASIGHPRFTEWIPCNGFTIRSPYHESSTPGFVGLERSRT